MSTNNLDHPQEPVGVSPKGSRTAVTLLTLGLAAALVGDGYLWTRSNSLNEKIAQTENGAQAQISKLNQATTTLLQQEQQRLDEIATQLKGVNDSAASAVRRARSEAAKQGGELDRKIAEQQERVAGELTQLKDTTTSKFTEFSSNVDGVKSDVDGVKSNVETVKSAAASTQSQLEKTAADLKTAMGDMGVMSGLIATNSKDLEALRALGTRNYFEFTLNKKQGSTKVGNIALMLKKADPKRNRYTVDVLADDKHVEKTDRTINEPVQLYVSGGMQPYEIVVNQVTKDQIVGYLATPKVQTARR